MRQLHLYLAAIVLLALCAFLILRQARQNSPASESSKVSAAAIRSTQPSLPDNCPTAQPAVHVPDRSVTSHATIPLQSPPEPSSDKHAPAIQLADNVQLPAVIIALSNPNKNPQHKIPPPVAAAMQNIVDSFYQELAASVRSNPLAGNTNHSGTDGQETVVIQPGPAVERARVNANEAYRALFGDEAFNLLTINAALEANLPKDSGQK